MILILLSHFKRLTDTCAAHFQLIIFLLTAQAAFDKTAQRDAIINPYTIRMVYFYYDTGIRAYGNIHQKVILALKPLFYQLCYNGFFYHSLTY